MRSGLIVVFIAEKGGTYIYHWGYCKGWYWWYFCQTESRKKILELEPWFERTLFQTIAIKLTCSLFSWIDVSESLILKWNEKLIKLKKSRVEARKFNNLLNLSIAGLAIVFLQTNLSFFVKYPYCTINIIWNFFFFLCTTKKYEKGLVDFQPYGIIPSRQNHILS